MEQSRIFYLFDFAFGKHELGGDTDAVVGNLQGVHI